MAKTVLIVEDEQSMQRALKNKLEHAGYTVLAAANGPEALSALECSEQPVHMLLTDMVMPGMNGVELARRARAVRRGIKVLYTTGYSDEVLARGNAPDREISAIVSKPFTAAELTRKVRQVLDSPV